MHIVVKRASPCRHGKIAPAVETTTLFDEYVTRGSAPLTLAVSISAMKASVYFDIFGVVRIALPMSEITTTWRGQGATHCVFNDMDPV